MNDSLKKGLLAVLAGGGLLLLAKRKPPKKDAAQEALRKKEATLQLPKGRIAQQALTQAQMLRRVVSGEVPTATRFTKEEVKLDPNKVPEGLKAQREAARWYFDMTDTAPTKLSAKAVAEANALGGNLYYFVADYINSEYEVGKKLPIRELFELIGTQPYTPTPGKRPAVGAPVKDAYRVRTPDEIELELANNVGVYNPNEQWKENDKGDRIPPAKWPRNDPNRLITPILAAYLRHGGKRVLGSPVAPKGLKKLFPEELHGTQTSPGVHLAILVYPQEAPRGEWFHGETRISQEYPGRSIELTCRLANEDEWSRLGVYNERAKTRVRRDCASHIAELSSPFRGDGRRYLYVQYFNGGSYGLCAIAMDIASPTAFVIRSGFYNAVTNSVGGLATFGSPESDEIVQELELLGGVRPVVTQRFTYQVYGSSQRVAPSGGSQWNFTGEDITLVYDEKHPNSWRFLVYGLSRRGVHPDFNAPLPVIMQKKDGKILYGAREFECVVSGQGCPGPDVGFFGVVKDLAEVVAGAAIVALAIPSGGLTLTALPAFAGSLSRAAGLALGADLGGIVQKYTNAFSAVGKIAGAIVPGLEGLSVEALRNLDAATLLNKVKFANISFSNAVGEIDKFTASITLTDVSKAAIDVANFQGVAATLTAFAGVSITKEASTNAASFLNRLQSVAKGAAYQKEVLPKLADENSANIQQAWRSAVSGSFQPPAAMSFDDLYLKARDGKAQEISSDLTTYFGKQLTGPSDPSVLGLVNLARVGALDKFTTALIDMPKKI